MNLEPSEAAWLRRAFAATSPADAPLPECPAADTLWEGVRGELSPGDLRELLRHIATCPVCTEAWRLAEKLEEIPEEEPRSSRFRFPAIGDGVSGTGALAAAALLVLVVGLMFWQGVGPSELRSGYGPPELEIRVATEPLPRDDCVLEWTDLEGAIYEIDVFVVDPVMQMLDQETGLVSSEYQVPEPALSGLPDGQTVWVEVRAFRDEDPLDEDPLVKARKKVRIR